MKKLHSLLLVTVLLFGLGASLEAKAGVTFDVIFRDTGTPTPTIAAGDNGIGCTTPGYYYPSPTSGYCMDYFMRISDDFVVCMAVPPTRRGVSRGRAARHETDSA